MSGLPFALVLSDLYGCSVTVATVRSATELWTFWEAWRIDAGPADASAARLVYHGRAVHVTRPPESMAAFRDWYLARAQR